MDLARAQQVPITGFLNKPLTREKVRGLPEQHLVYTGLGSRQQLFVGRIQGLFALVRPPITQEQVVRGVVSEAKRGGRNRSHVVTG